MRHRLEVLAIFIASLCSDPGVSSAQGFVANAGQWPAAVQQRLRKGPLTAWFTAVGWTLALERARPGRAPDANDAMLHVQNPLAAGAHAVRDGVAVRMTLDGSAGSAVVGEQVGTAYHNFLVGDSSSWRTRVQEHACLRYRAAYPGVDVVVRPSRNLFEYDLELASAGAAAQVVIRCEGIERLELLGSGTLRMHTALGPIDQEAPVTWQGGAGGRRLACPCRYRLLGSDSFGFALEGAIPGAPVVIDPDLRWSTFLGGAMSDHGNAIVRSANGLVTIAGDTSSTPFPTTLGAYQAIPGGLLDAFVSRMDESLAGTSQLVWSTYVGGNGDDNAFDVAVDGAGFVTIVGYTLSTNFPVTSGSPGPGGQLDAFVTRLWPAGNQLFFSRYLGGVGNDWATAVHVDQNLVATVLGTTESTPFPLTANAYSTLRQGGNDTFVTRLDASGSNAITYSTLLGGNNLENNLWTGWQGYPLNIKTGAITTLPNGQLLIGGMTWSTNFPTTANAFSRVNQGFADSYLTVLDITQLPSNQLVYSTLFGGNDNEWINDLGVDTSGRIIFGGCSWSTNLPTTVGAYSRTLAGRDDAIVVRMDPSQTGAAQLSYATFLGGIDWDCAHGLTIDARGFVTCGGFCGAGFPVSAGAYNQTFRGSQDAWLAKLRLEGKGAQDLVYSTMLGDTLYDLLHDLAPDGRGGALGTGATQSAAFPTVGNPYHGLLGGSYDAFVSHLDLLPSNVARGSGPRPHCAGDVIFEVDRVPVALAPFELLVGNAPPGTAGALTIGNILTTGIPVLGAELFVNPVVALPWGSDAGGSAKLVLMTPPGLNGTLGLQTVWINTVTCAGSQVLSSSAILGL